MPKRRKSLANARVPQDREEMARAIARIGELRREIDRRTADYSDQIATIQRAVEDALKPFRDELVEHEQGVQSFAEANRSELTSQNKRKFASCATGRVLWRSRPASVRLRKVADIIESLKTLKLDKFLRTKTEVDKEAMLKDQKTAATIAGVTIASDGEDFVIEPAEIEVT